MNALIEKIRELPSFTVINRPPDSNGRKAWSVMIETGEGKTYVIRLSESGHNEDVDIVLKSIIDATPTN